MYPTLALRIPLSIKSSAVGCLLFKSGTSAVKAVNILFLIDNLNCTCPNQSTSEIILADFGSAGSYTNTGYFPRCDRF